MRALDFHYQRRDLSEGERFEQGAKLGIGKAIIGLIPFYIGLKVGRGENPLDFLIN